MGKIIDGVELLRMIRDKELKENTKFKIIGSGRIYEYRGGDKIYDFSEETNMRACWLIGTKFEILSDDEIDIDSILEIDINDDYKYTEQDIEHLIHFFTGYLNKIIKAVKQLNKKLEEK
jgi:hypothetical protein